jgi:hypothetical protein
MKSWLWVFAALGCACGGDGTSAGTRGQCAEGGQLNAGTCPVDRTPEGACTYLVECGVIPISSDNNNRFDWGACVDTIQRFIATGEELVIDCIEASTCDALKVDGSPDDPNEGQISCLHLGGG